MKNTPFSTLTVCGSVEEPLESMQHLRVLTKILEWLDVLHLLNSSGLTTVILSDHVSYQDTVIFTFSKTASNPCGRYYFNTIQELLLDKDFLVLNACGLPSNRMTPTGVVVNGLSVFEKGWPHVAGKT